MISFILVLEIRKRDHQRSTSKCFSRLAYWKRPDISLFQPEECKQVADLTAKEQFGNELLLLLRSMYHVERDMLFIGLTDVIKSIEQNLADFIVLAENSTHLSTPLNFLTRLTKLAEAKTTPYVYACSREQLGWACRLSTGISAISIKIGRSYFSEKINAIRGMIATMTSSSVVTL